MILTTDHKVLSSFKEYLSYKVLNDLQAYQNRNVNLYEYPSTIRIKNKSVYGSPYAQWVYDSSVSGANVPTGIYSGSGSGVIGRSGAQSLKLDYKNGRAIMASGNTGMSLTANVAVKEINFYTTSDSEERLIFENTYQVLPDIQAATNYVPPDTVIAPCIFCKLMDVKADELSLGGMTYAEWKIRVIAICATEAQIIGVGSVIRKMFGDVFPLLDSTPLDELNDIKSPPWNYVSNLSSIANDKIIYVDDVMFRYKEIDSFAKKNPRLLLGIGEIDLRKDNT